MNERVLTDEEVTQAFESILGMPPRGADKAVVAVMGGTVEVLAEYLWDHWMGEPDEISVDEVAELIVKSLQPEEK